MAATLKSRSPSLHVVYCGLVETLGSTKKTSQTKTKKNLKYYFSIYLYVPKETIKSIGLSPLVKSLMEIEQEEVANELMEFWKEKAEKVKLEQEKKWIKMNRIHFLKINI